MPFHFYHPELLARYSLEQQRQKPGPTPTRLADDPRLVQNFLQLQPTSGKIVLGQVLFSLPHRHWYRVVLSGQQGEIGCCRMVDHSCHVLGLRDAGTIVPGSLVLVYRDRQLPFGVILGVLPEPRSTVRGNYSDWIAPQTAVGFFEEPYYAAMLRLLTDQGRTLNFVQHRPIDGLAVGEWAKFTELGGGLFLDAFQAFLRMDETCGLWLFFFDRLLRLSGYNFDLRTAASELTARMDEREAQWVQGWSPYLWEALGLLRPELELQQTHETPLHPAQQPFWRSQHFQGYLGQGGMRQVVVPPSSGGEWSPDREPWRLFPTTEEEGSPPPSPMGVFREHIGLDGSYQLASAHSIFIEKRVRIPVPVQCRSAEDPRGDSRENAYHPAGREGAHEPGRSDLSEAAERIGLALRDLQCQAQWKALHPFVYHERDFHVPRASAEDRAWKLDHPDILDRLKQDPVADLPPQTDPIRIDHRQTEQRYYEGCSGVFLTPEGSVLIRDAWGGEIRLHGGNLYLTVPGNIYLQSGKSIVQLAGHDCIMRAKNSADISAGEHDVRIKAQNNLHMLAREGGLLLESQSSRAEQRYESLVGEDVESSGIVLKSLRGPVVARGQDIQLVARDGKGIAFDAGREGDIRTVSRRFERFLESMAVDAFPAESPKAVYSFTADVASLPAQLLVGGPVFASDRLSVSGSIVVGGGHISTDQGGLVGRNHPETSAALQRAKSEGRQFNQQLSQQMGENYVQSIRRPLYEQGGPASPEFARDVTFGFRSPRQMRSDRFRLPEAWWQTLLRRSGRGQPWRELSLEHPSLEGRLPFPGHPWQEQSLLIAGNWTLFDGETYLEKDLDPAVYGPLLRVDTIGELAVPEQEYRVLGP